MARSSSTARSSPEPAVVLGRVHLGDDDLAHLAAGAGDRGRPDGRPRRPWTIAPPVPIVSSSGWAWTVIRVGPMRGRLGGRACPGRGGGLIGHAAMLTRSADPDRDAARPLGDAALPSRDGTTPRLRAAGRPDRHRLLDGPRRAVLHDAPGRSRGGRHQGGAAGRRRDARLGAAVGRVGEADGTRTAAYYLAVNRNKRSHPARPQVGRRAPRSCGGSSAAATSWSRTSGRVASRASASMTTSSSG